MTAVLLEIPRRPWACPSCNLRTTTVPGEATPYHPCAGLKGLAAPLVPCDSEGIVRGVRHVAVEREDYVGAEIVQYDTDGRPMMAVRTERYDGSNDCNVLLPTAQTWR